MTWSRRVAGLADALRHAPGTLIYLCCLLVTQLTLNTLDTPLSRRLVLGVSTNLHNMAESPVRVLIGSAFWTDTSPLHRADPGGAAAGDGAGGALARHRSVAGHAAGRACRRHAADAGGDRLRVARGDAAPVPLRMPPTSGSATAFSPPPVCLTYRFPRRSYRLGWALLTLSLLVVLALLLGSHQEIGDLGHLSAFGLGLAMHPLTMARRPALSPEGPGAPTGPARGAPDPRRSTDAVEPAPRLWRRSQWSHGSLWPTDRAGASRWARSRPGR